MEVLDSALKHHQKSGINDGLYADVAAMNALATATKGF